MEVDMSSEIGKIFKTIETFEENEQYDKAVEELLKLNNKKMIQF